MTEYKRRKLIKFAKFVDIPLRDPEEIICSIAPNIVCESTDLNCPAIRSCAGQSDPGVCPSSKGTNGFLAWTKFCRKQLLRWYKS